MRIACALVAVVGLTACGGGHHGPSARDRVSAYLAHENSISAQMQPSLVAVHQALVDFSHHRSSPTTVKELTTSIATLEKLHRRLAATDPPPQAAKLQRLLLELVTREESLTRELRQLTTFEPAFAKAVAPLAAANTETQARLKTTKKPAAVAALVRSYQSAVEGALAAARKLQPPALERPVYAAELVRLEELAAALGKLAAAAQAHDAQGAALAEHDVSVASVSSDSRANQVAEQNAVRAYDRAVRKIAILGTQITDERNRLQIKLR